MSGSVSAYCTCIDAETGKPYRQGGCPQWAARNHRRWRFVVDLRPEWSQEAGRHVRRQLKRSGFATKAAAEAALLSESHAISVGEAPTLAHRQITVGQWLDQWLAGKPDLRPASRKTYEQAISRYLRPALGQMRLAELRAEHVDELLLRVRSGRLSLGGKPPSPATVSMVFRVLNGALAVAVRRRMLTWNPCTAVEPGAVPKHQAKAWDADERVRFLALAAEKEPDLAIGWRLASYWTLRRGETVALRWADVDLEARRLHVRRNAVEVAGVVHLGPPKSASSARTIPMDGPTVAALKAHKKRQLAVRLAAGPDWQDEDLILTDARGGMVQPWLYTRTFSRLVEQAGLPVIPLHGLRNTAISCLLAQGVPPKVVQQIAGHATLAQTMDGYAVVYDTDMDAAARAVERSATGL